MTVHNYSVFFTVLAFAFPNVVSAHDGQFNCLVQKECSSVTQCKDTNDPMMLQLEQFGLFVKVEFPASKEVYYLTNKTQLRDPKILQASRPSVSDDDGMSSLTVFANGAFMYSVHMAPDQVTKATVDGAQIRLKSGFCQGATS